MSFFAFQRGNLERFSPASQASLPVQHVSPLATLAAFSNSENEVPAEQHIQTWLTLLNQAGLGDLANLVENGSISVPFRKAAPGWKRTSWHTRWLATPELIVNLPRLSWTSSTNALIQREAQAFWDFSEALYEIYFYESLWLLRPAYWVQTFQSTRHDPIQSILNWIKPGQEKRIQRILSISEPFYDLFNSLSNGGELKICIRLAKHDLREPSLLASALGGGWSPQEYSLNRRDFAIFRESGIQEFETRLTNRLGQRFMINYVSGVIRRLIRLSYVVTIGAAVIALPSRIENYYALSGPMLSASQNMVKHPEIVLAAQMKYIVAGYRHWVQVRDQFQTRASLTEDEREDLDDALREIRILERDYPTLKSNPH